MGISMLGRKVGMTRVFREDGSAVPVSVLKVGPCVVTQVKSADGPDGYGAVQIGFEDMKARNSTIPMIGHDARASTGPKRVHREFRVDAKEAEGYSLGQTLTIEALADLKFVDIVATSKGKGFQGVMKRHNFKGVCASHGTERKHRSPGSIGGNSNNRGTGNNKKGIRMAGQMGNGRVTMRSLDVVRLDADIGLLLVKGPVPGPNNGLVEIRTPVRLFKPKARKQNAKE